jgi:hypothetical protein
MNIPANEQNAMRERYKKVCLDGPEPLPEWPDAILLKITWLEQATLPDEFDLYPGSHVQNGARYRELLLQALENADPRSAISRSAAACLESLYKQFGNTEAQ